MNKITDRLGQIVKNGDAVRYWHKVNGRSTPEIGEVVGFLYSSGEIRIERKNYNDTNISFRRSSGITKLSKAEAVLWKMEQFISDESKNI
jgi:hypothetical protein